MRHTPFSSEFVQVVMAASVVEELGCIPKAKKPPDATPRVRTYFEDFGGTLKKRVPEGLVKVLLAALCINESPKEALIEARLVASLKRIFADPQRQA
jgi:hypothetical protein